MKTQHFLDPQKLTHTKINEYIVISFLYILLAQSVHVDDPAAATQPSRQSVGVDVAFSHFFPSGHVSQVVDPKKVKITISEQYGIFIQAAQIDSILMLSKKKLWCFIKLRLLVGKKIIKATMQCVKSYRNFHKLYNG